MSSEAGFEKVSRGCANPFLAIVGSFLGMIVIGTVLLLLPISHYGGLTFTQAAFTSTSAVCVTGLIVVDTGTAFTRFGQTVILLLIQCGGLGIITLSLAVFQIFFRRISISTQLIVREASGGLSFAHLRNLLFSIIGWTLVFESVGAITLYYLFTDLSGSDRIFSAVFHSISAFCNAGFSLNGDSLISYSDRFPVLAIVGILVILGGLGFPVLYDLMQPRREMSLHSRAVLTMTGVFLLTGTVMVYILERGNSLGGMSFGDSWSNAFFQSLTTRTAGFNSIAFDSLRQSTLFLMSMFMFIGGAPGGTAGGVKVTTVLVALLVLRKIIRGDYDTTFGNRRVSSELVDKTIAILTISFIFVTLVSGAVLLVEEVVQDTPHLFLQVLFEVVSAFGTVGLSTGLTSKLSEISQWIIIFTMFLGRVGPLTLLLALGRTGRRARARYPEGDIMVG